MNDEIEYYVGFINGVLNYHAIGDNYEGVDIQNSEDALDLAGLNHLTFVKKFTQKSFYERFKVDISEYF